MPRAGRTEEWAAYLGSVRLDQGMPEAQRTKALEVWAEMEKVRPDISLPSAGKDEGDFYFSWNSEERMLDVVVKADGSVTWVFANYVHDLTVGSEECGPEGYKVFLPMVSRTTREDMVHMDAGCRAWAVRLDVEKKCGMTHSEETNAWIEAERERAGR